LNREVVAGWPPTWDGDDLPLLWRYNMHYFEWLWSLDYHNARLAVSDWIDRHPLVAGNVGWDAYPTSLRLMNWSALFFGEWRERLEEDVGFRERLWRSVYTQSEWLSRRLEFHLLGNHLLENAAALVTVGSFLEGPEAAAWYGTGRAILDEQLEEQLLADGTHFERSPMYHLRATYVLAFLVNCSPGLLEAQRERLERMRTAMSSMCHPDGRIALLNDSAFGIYNEPLQLTEFVGRVLGESSPTLKFAEGPFELPEAGYYGFRGGDGSYVICDAGPIGPDYLPGHAHGDIFSFEMSLGGRRVIVDSGVFDYETGEARRFCRSTSAHNTVEIDGHDQCEFWGAFRVARRGRPHDVAWRATHEGFDLAGWHDGYRRLAGEPTHGRRFVWRDPGRLTITDRVSGRRPLMAKLRFGLHPDCGLLGLDGGSAQVAHPAGRLRVSVRGPGRLSAEETPYFPEFGVRRDRTTLVYTASGSELELETTLESA
jgi:uncharacterized heparinase superfamily protein